MPRRPLPAYAAVWLVGALVATGTGLVAVRLVSGAVGNREVAPLSAAAVEEALRDAAAAPPAPAGAPSAGPDLTPLPGGPREDLPLTPATPAAPRVTTAPRGPASPVPSPPAAPSAPVGLPQPPPAPPPTTGAATYRVVGGVVAVGCTGTTARLRYATPSSGWRATVEVAIGERVEVEFERDDDRARARVTCPGGRPVLEPDDRGSGGSGSGGSGSGGSGSGGSGSGGSGSGGSGSGSGD